MKLKLDLTKLSHARFHFFPHYMTQNPSSDFPASGCSSIDELLLCAVKIPFFSVFKLYDFWRHACLFPPCCQIFMCLLWVLLQFVVLGMYWDVPPISSEGGAAMMEMKREEVEEEVPLMGSDEEAVHTYRAVSSDQLETSISSEMQPVHRASDPFKNFSASRGEPAALTACLKQWLSAFPCPPFCGAQVGRGVTANAHVSYLLHWFSCIRSHGLTHTLHSPGFSEEFSAACQIRFPVYWLDLCVCVCFMSVHVYTRCQVLYWISVIVSLYGDCDCLPLFNILSVLSLTVCVCVSGVGGLGTLICLNHVVRI